MQFETWVTQAFTIQDRVQVWKLQVFPVEGQDQLVIIHGGEFQGSCANQLWIYA